MLPERSRRDDTFALWRSALGGRFGSRIDLNRLTFPAAFGTRGPLPFLVWNVGIEGPLG